MLARLSILVVVVISAVLSSDGRAEACEVVAGPVPATLPVCGSTVGSIPVLVGEVGREPRLVHADDPEQRPIPIEVDTTLAGFSVGGAMAKAYRPTAPLTAGPFVWRGLACDGSPQDIAFYVDPGLAPAPVALGALGMRVTLDEPEDPGCGASSSCEDVDFTRLELSIEPPEPGAETPSYYLLELSTPRDGRRFVELVEAQEGASGTRHILIWDRALLGSFKDVRHCVALTPVSDEGTTGGREELGCFDPEAEDPRVVDRRGCALGDSGGSSLGLWLGFLLVMRRRR